jgi:hypothetical protein
MTNAKPNTTAGLGSSGSGRNGERKVYAERLKLKHIDDCPHRKLAVTLTDEKEPPNKPCLNELCFAIGELFESLEWAKVTEKQINLMGKVMHCLDCACYSKILYADKD